MDRLDDDRKKVVFILKENAFSQEGGLASTGVASWLMVVSLRLRVLMKENALNSKAQQSYLKSQDTAVEGILAGKVKAGEVVVIR